MTLSTSLRLPDVGDEPSSILGIVAGAVRLSEGGCSNWMWITRPITLASENANNGGRGGVPGDLLHPGCHTGVRFRPIMEVFAASRSMVVMTYFPLYIGITESAHSTRILV